MSTSSAASELAPAPMEGISGGLDISGRLLSLDALRGFDMFWIVGAEELVGALHRETGIIGLARRQLQHVEWEGFRFYDMIFPLFVFLVGVSLVFSLDKIVAKEGASKAYVRVIKRFLLLYVVGIIYYGGMSHLFPEMRLVGVLQRIATAYLFASLLYLNFRLRGLIIACAAILLGYWALFSFVSVPAEPALAAMNPAWGQGGISTAVGNNWAHYVDFHFLPGRRYEKNWDPEGLLSSIPAVGTALLGIFAGLLLKNPAITKEKKVVYLLGAGVLAVIAGMLWGVQFPVIKKIWTSSYVLVAGGYSSILLGMFYAVIDVWGYKRWATPFVWIGCNALTAYLLCRFVEFEELGALFVGGHIKEAAGGFGDLLLVGASMGILFAILRFLYNRKIFLRL